MMKKITRYLFAALAVMGIGSTQCAYSATEWTGNTVSGVTSTGKPTNDSQVCFLYNVGTGKFLYPGGLWGSQASLRNDIGLKVWIEKYSSTNSQYCINTDINNSDSDLGSYLAYVYKTSQDFGLFCDRTKTEDISQEKWTFTQTASDSKIYNISCSVYDNGYKTYYMEYNKTSGSLDIVNGETSTAAKANTNAQWKIVTLKDMKALFSKSPADLGTPVDATFFMNDPDFQRNHSQLKKWTSTFASTPDYIRFGVEDFYKTSSATSYTYYGTEATYHKAAGVSLTTDNNDTQRTYGSYFSVDVNNANNGKLSQNVTVDKAGWYVVKCQGFYSPAT